MNKKFFKKIISSSILVGLLFPAFLISTTPKKVNAQLDPYNFLGTSTDVVSDITTLVNSVRGCTKDDQKEIKKEILKSLAMSSVSAGDDATSIINSITSLADDLGVDVSGLIDQLGSNYGIDNLGGTIGGILDLFGVDLGGGTGEPTDPSSLDETTEIDTNTKYEVQKSEDAEKASGESDDNVPIVNTEVLAELKAVKEATMKEKKKETCYDRVAYVTSRMILKNNVKKTLGWITNGNYGGNPLYLTDTESYFKNIATLEVEKFIDDVSKDTVSPFVADIKKAAIDKYSKATEGKTDFNMDKIIGSNWKSFEDDFSVGGWEGWLALTQNQDNNFVGAGLKAGEKLQNQLEEKKQNALTELSTSGVMPEKKCVAGEEVTLESGSTYCNKYETVTPSSAIQDQINQVINSGNKQLENTTELGETFDKLFGDIIQNLISDGLGSLKENLGIE
ncbi:MAG: hypothetical protein WDK96_02955 [Candidatus Paceibacterota bacterium]|jgi:hypothetical protein